MFFVMYVEYLHKYQASNVEFDATYEDVVSGGTTLTPTQGLRRSDQIHFTATYSYFPGKSLVLIA